MIDYEKLREFLKQQIIDEDGNGNINNLHGWPSVAYDCICEGGPDYLVRFAIEEKIDLKDFSH